MCWPGTVPSIDFEVVLQVSGSRAPRRSIKFYAQMYWLHDPWVLLDRLAAEVCHACRSDESFAPAPLLQHRKVDPAISSQRYVLNPSPSSSCKHAASSSSEAQPSSSLRSVLALAAAKESLLAANTRTDIKEDEAWRPQLSDDFHPTSSLVCLLGVALVKA